MSPHLKKNINLLIQSFWLRNKEIIINIITHLHLGGGAEADQRVAADFQHASFRSDRSLIRGRSSSRGQGQGHHRSQSQSRGQGHHQSVEKHR